MTRLLEETQRLLDDLGSSTTFWILAVLCVLFGTAALIGDLSAWIRGGEVEDLDGTRVTFVGDDESDREY